MYLIFYDISETRIRTKVAKLLVKEGYERLQFSVFTAPYNPYRSNLWDKLHDLLKDTPNNKIYCLKIGKNNFYKMKIIGIFDFDLSYLTGEKRSLII